MPATGSIESKKNNEATARLRPTYSAIKSLVHRGRETLKEKLKSYLQTGDWKQ